MAIINASERFGVAAVDDDSEESARERDRIASVIAEMGRRPKPPIGEFRFYGIVTKQSTNNQGNIIMSLEVPWEHRHEVWRALGTMPFACTVTMTEAEMPSD